MSYSPAPYVEQMYTIRKEKTALFKLSSDALVQRLVEKAEEHSIAKYAKTGRKPTSFRTKVFPFMEFLTYTEDGWEISFVCDAYISFLTVRFAMAEGDSDAIKEKFCSAYGEDKLLLDIPLVLDGDEKAIREFVEKTLFKFIVPTLIVSKG